MAKCSAGILLYNRVDGELRVLLAHPGGPYWTHRDFGAWTIPKGELDDGENAQACARREFQEETGMQALGELQPLGEIVQKGGKRVIAFALEGSFDVSGLRSNSFELEWPPRSGRMQTFPEIDRAMWMDLPLARAKMIPSQIPLLETLAGW